MKVFVASWFFPPATSSEGIVTYKLLRNSENNYQVFSSRSKLWGYKASMEMKDEKNIETYSIETDDIDEWKQWCIAEFEKRYEQEKYDCVMTRSTPPESVLIGQAIKEKYSDVKWIASLADPVANNPYELKAYIDDNESLTSYQKVYLKNALRTEGDALIKEWEEKRPEAGIKLLCKLKRWEDMVLEKADLIISPSTIQLRYLLGARPWREKLFALPHSFDATFYKGRKKETEKIVLSFLGYSDQLRSLRPIVQAVQKLKEDSNDVLNNIEIRFIGNNPREIQDMVLNYYLDDYIHFMPGVDYYASLELMEEADWLIHVDAYFSEIQTGGSIFFAGKLADYMGAGKPILALTGKNSPADAIVRRYGGFCCEVEDITRIADCIEKIGRGYTAEIDDAYRYKYNARSVAGQFDQRLQQLVRDDYTLKRTVWPSVAEAKNEKLLSICVPSYNVERYLDRCLFTLVNHPMAPYLDIMIVDDGSKDHTAVIGKAYEDRYPGIVRLLSKENGGHGSTINLAIENAKGKYFRTVDGDDWVDGRELTSLLELIREKDIDADVISSNYHEINIESAKMTPVEQGGNIEFNKEYTFGMLDPEKTYLTLAGMQIKTEVLRKMRMKLQEHTFYVDVEFILFPVPYIHTILFTKHFIYKYARGNSEQSVAIPNMVKRYDHHNRVMRRVIQYEKRVQMDAGQRAYYDAILKRLLCTHYFLCLVYDEDKKQGCARAKEFDAFLYHVRPDLARWVGEKIPAVRVVRQCNYNSKRFEHSLVLLLRKSGERALTELFGLGRALTKNDFVRKLIYNQATVSLAQSEFFTEGHGKILKDKINSLFIN